MNSHFEIRPYQPGDESAILELFELSFNRPMDRNYWDWRFRDNPAPGIAISLAWDGEILAAHYAISPVVMQIAGEPRLTALSMTTMSHPNYRGKGLFIQLASNLYEQLRQQGYFMVWGFPNGNSHRGFIRNLDWCDVGEIPIFQLNLIGWIDRHDVSESVHELYSFDVQADRLWTNTCRNNNISVQRDKKYLTWRYCENPKNQYRILGYSHFGELLGYIVFKSYQSEVDIVDILTIDDLTVGVELVRSVAEISIQEGMKGLNMWQPFHHRLHLELEKLGFQNGSPVTYLGTRMLHKSQVGLDVTDLRNWHFSMGDSDVF